MKGPVHCCNIQYNISITEVFYYTVRVFVCVPLPLSTLKIDNYIHPTNKTCKYTKEAKLAFSIQKILKT